MSEFNVTVKRTTQANRECTVTDDNGAFDTAAEAGIILPTCVPNAAERQNPLLRSQYQFVIGDQTYTYQDLVNIKRGRPNAHPFPTAGATPPATPPAGEAATPATEGTAPAPAPTPAPPAPVPTPAPAAATPAPTATEPGQMGRLDATTRPRPRAVEGEVSVDVLGVFGPHSGHQERVTFDLKVPLTAIDRNTSVLLGAGVYRLGVTREGLTPGGERWRSDPTSYGVHAGIGLAQDFGPFGLALLLGGQMGSLSASPDRRERIEQNDCPDGPDRTCDLSQSGPRDLPTHTRGLQDGQSARNPNGGTVTSGTVEAQVSVDLGHDISAQLTAGVISTRFNPNSSGRGAVNTAFVAGLGIGGSLPVFGGAPAAEPARERAGRRTPPAAQAPAPATPTAPAAPQVQELSALTGVVGQAVGYPAPQGNWPIGRVFVNGTGTDMMITAGNQDDPLVIPAATLSHDGEYRIEIRNDAGQTLARFNLNVRQAIHGSDTGTVRGIAYSLATPVESATVAVPVTTGTLGVMLGRIGFQRGHTFEVTARDEAGHVLTKFTPPNDAQPVNILIPTDKFTVTLNDIIGRPGPHAVTLWVENDPIGTGSIPFIVTEEPRASVSPDPRDATHPYTFMNSSLKVQLRDPFTSPTQITVRMVAQNGTDEIFRRDIRVPANQTEVTALAHGREGLRGNPSRRVTGHLQVIIGSETIDLPGDLTLVR